MITMVNKNQILLLYYREGLNKSEISRKTGINRRTVRKYIQSHERQNYNELSKDNLEKGLSSKPVYDTSSRTKTKLTIEVEEEIKSCLEENRKKRSSGFHKQQQKKIDIFEYLQEKGYKIGYTTVCNYIREQEQKGKEGYIKQLYQPGSQTEFDWGEVKLYIDGQVQTMNIAVFTSAYSNHRWAKLFYRQDTLAFSQSHIDYFSALQGVHKEVVYDNMRVAVRKFVGRTEKEPTEALLELSNYYTFGFRFCNVRRGNEKGHVERSVEYIRRKAFSKRMDFSSVSQANEYLLQEVEKLNNKAQQLRDNQSANQIFEKEKAYLYPVSADYICFKEEIAKVDKYSTVILYGNRYSVPDYLVGKLVTVKVFAEKINVFFNREFVCSHERSYGLHTWTMDINHYLTTLFRKPGALKNSVIFEQLSQEIQKFYDEYFSDNSKDFVELLRHCKEHHLEWKSIKNAENYLKKICPTNISKDTILAVIDKTNEPERTETKDEIHEASQNILKELTTNFN